MSNTNQNSNKRSLNELNNLIMSGIYTDDDFKEFQSLIEANRSAKEERKKKLSEIHFLIQSLGSGESSITPNEVISLFSQGLLVEVAQTIHLAGSKKPIGTKTGKERASDKELELFHVPKEGKPGDKAFSLRKGRIYERYNASNAGPFIVDKANFPKKLLAIGTSEDELMKYVSQTDHAKVMEYLSTVEGKAEITKILEVVANAKEKLDKHS